MKKTDNPQSMEMLRDLAVLNFLRQKDWGFWLKKNHKSSTGVWLRIAKKSSASPSVTHAEALSVALCYGWIDGQKRPDSEQAWLQKFTPRREKSMWSKINRDRALALIESGKMQPAGLLEIERAKQDGRWEAAYDSARTAEVPADLEAALMRNAKAREFFKTLNGANRYAVLFRIQTAKKAETRARKIDALVAMLERGEKVHP